MFAQIGMDSDIDENLNICLRYIEAGSQLSQSAEVDRYNFVHQWIQQQYDEIGTNLTEVVGDRNGLQYVRGCNNRKRCY